MKTLLVLAAALVASATTSFAQAPASAGPAATAQKSPDQQAARRAQYLTRELGLTADQQAKLEPILLAQRQELLALRDRAQAGNRQGMGQELKAAQTKYVEQIRAVLTPEQFAKFDQLKDDQREQMRERRANGQGLRGRQ